MEKEKLNKELQRVIGSLISKDYFKLEFGCKFNYFGDEYTLILFNGMDGTGSPYLEAIKTNDLIRWNWSSNLIKKIDNYSSKNVEIIGQEPSLNDVLMAIHKIKGSKYLLGVDGELWLQSNEFGEPILEVDLSKSLFQQSESTLQAIYNLLKSDEK